MTGAGAPRIGNFIARDLAKRGYQLAVHANRSIVQAEETVKDLEAAGSRAIAVQADLTDEQAVGRMVDTVVERFGHIEALVNCAAIWEPRVLEDVTAADVRRHFDANALSTFLCCQRIGLQMVSQDHGGNIVNIGDWAVIRPYGDYSAYFPSKGAVTAITRSFAVELARRNPYLRVNEVLPGPVMFPDHLSAADRRAAIAGTLVKREGKPRNIADAVAFLLENDYITGVSLPVDGGVSAR